MKKFKVATVKFELESDCVDLVNNAIEQGHLKTTKQICVFLMESLSDDIQEMLLLNKDVDECFTITLQ